MASPHCKVKNGKRGNGAKHAQYVARADRYGDREDMLYLEDGNLPKWASNAEEFFAIADQQERANGRVYKEVEAAIPREAKDPIQWAKDFAQELLGDKHPYRLGVHDKEAKDGGRNAHIHLMFSTRTMDGYDRTPKSFFKNAARRKDGKEPSPEQIEKGGARKSEYWNDRMSVPDTRAAFERHVQRVAPEFKLKRSEAPEPKIGPELKRAGKNYEKGRAARAEQVYELRSLKKQRDELTKEIEKEQAREKEAEKPKSITDELWSRANIESPPQIEEKKQEKAATKELEGKPVDWSRFRNLAGVEATHKEPESKAVDWSKFRKLAGVEVTHKEPESKAVDWSQFRNLAGASSDKTDNKKDEKMNPMSDLPSGPGYFPETKADKEMREGEGAAFQRLEQQKSDQSEQQRGTDGITNDLWRQMEKDREQREQKDRDRDSGNDHDFF